MTSAESVIVARDGNGSLRPEDRNQIRVAPGSLLWKYVADKRAHLVVGQAGITENMHPQLGQAVSDHSLIFENLFERVRRSAGPILSTIYGEAPEKTAIRVRNYHRALSGTVQGSKYDGTRYEGLDPETFYWAHATFVHVYILVADRFIKRLSRAEKEQMYAEACDWFSLYGMDASVQPATYGEFEEYWERMVREELVGDSRVAQYTCGFIKKGVSRVIPKPQQMPDWMWSRVVAPSIDSFVTMMGAGALDSVMREKLDIPWSRRQAVIYPIVCAVIRALGPIYERRVPLEKRYYPEAVEGFKREGIDPRTITLESAIKARETIHAAASARTAAAEPAELAEESA